MSTSDKLLAVFGLFTLEQPEWTVEAVAERLDLAVSTAYRYVKSLSDAGLISAYAPGRYVLGPAIVQLDRQTRLLDPLIRLARPIMVRIVGDMQIPGVLLLCRLYRKQVMCIHQEAFDRPLSTISYERGRPMSLYRGAASKVILANMKARSVRSLFDGDRAAMQAAGFPSEWEGVKAMLRTIRAGRVCVTSGELDIGMVGLAAPLFSAAGPVDASLGFVLPGKFCSAGRQARIIGELDRGAAEIDRALAAFVWQNGRSAIAARPDAHDIRDEPPGLPLNLERRPKRLNQRASNRKLAEAGPAEPPDA